MSRTKSCRRIQKNPTVTLSHPSFSSTQWNFQPEPHNVPLKMGQPPLVVPIQHQSQGSFLTAVLVSVAMASNKQLSAAILVLSLLAFSTFTAACGGKPCKRPAPVEQCPRDTLKLGVCADLLGLVNIVVGSPPSTKCCPLIQGLADLEAALCLCTAIKANVLGINLNVPVALSLILSACQKAVPPGFQCA